MPYSVLELSALKILDLKNYSLTLRDAKNNIKKTLKKVIMETLFSFSKLHPGGFDIDRGR